MKQEVKHHKSCLVTLEVPYELVRTPKHEIV